MRIAAFEAGNDVRQLIEVLFLGTAEIAREGIACRLLINSQPRMSLGLFSAGVQFFFHEFHQCRTPFGRIAVGCQQAADTAATIDAQTFCIILGGNTPGIVVAGQYIAAHADLLQIMRQQ